MGIMMGSAMISISAVEGTLAGRSLSGLFEIHEDELKSLTRDNRIKNKIENKLIQKDFHPATKANKKTKMVRAGDLK